MEGIKFDNKHTWLDYGLILTKKTIGVPTPDTQLVKVPGRSGVIDLSEFLGHITYSNRALKFEFEVIKKQADYYNLFAKIQNELHGKRMKVILDIDKDYYFMGRVYINEWETDKKIGKLVIEVDADPYKYKINITNHSLVIGAGGRETVTLKNLKMPVTPTFQTSGEVIIEFENGSYTVNGTGAVADILLIEGENVLIIDGEQGTIVTISYQEGGL